MAATTTGAVHRQDLSVEEGSPPDLRRPWIAEIEWSETEDGARFSAIARADDGAADEVIVAHSRPLDWPPKDPACLDTLTAAVETLEVALLGAGWRPLANGRAWYAKRFEFAPSASRGGSAAGDLESAARSERLLGDPWGVVRESGDRPVVRRGVLVATVGQLVLAAAVIGALLGRGFVGGDSTPAARPAAASLTIDHGGLRLHVPSGWSRGRAVTVPGFSRPLSLKNTRERLRAVVERLPASSATLVPVAFQQARPTADERREVVRLSPGQPAWRYRVTHENGSTTVLYTAPTTSGVATVACLVPTGTGVPRGCETLAKAITVPGSVPLELGMSVAFYTRLPTVARELEVSRSIGMRDLAAAKSATAQAAAADALVRAHEHAVAALAPLTGTRADLPGKTVRALNAMAGAYVTLANAARARSPQRYNAAGRGVADADADLRRTLAKAAAAADAAERSPTDAGRRAP